MTGVLEGAETRIAGAPYSPISSATPFVRADGRNFTLGGQPFFVGGTSWHNLMQARRQCASAGLFLRHADRRSRLADHIPGQIAFRASTGSRFCMTYNLNELSNLCSALAARGVL